MLAGALDRMGKLEMAFDELKKALQVDPLALPVRHAFQDVAGRLRAALADPARPADDADVPRLYTLLVEAGDALARVARAQGDLARVAQAEAEAAVAGVQTPLFGMTGEAEA